MYLPNFSFLAQFGGVLCAKQTQKMKKIRKTEQKTAFLKLGGGEMWLKSRDLQNAHLRSLFNVRTKFQLPSSIWRRDRGGIALFWDQKGEETPYTSPN